MCTYIYIYVTWRCSWVYKWQTLWYLVISSRSWDITPQTMVIHLSVELEPQVCIHPYASILYIHPYWVLSYQKNWFYPNESHG